MLPAIHRHSTPGKRPGGAASPFSLKLHSDKFTNARSTAIRCVCGDNSDRGHMIQCEVHLVAPLVVQKALCSCSSVE